MKTEKIDLYNFVKFEVGKNYTNAKIKVLNFKPYENHICSWINPDTNRSINLLENDDFDFDYWIKDVKIKYLEEIRTFRVLNLSFNVVKKNIDNFNKLFKLWIVEKKSENDIKNEINILGL